MPQDSAPRDRAAVRPAQLVRNDLDLTRQQLDAIERWHAVHRTAQSDAALSTASRETRMDLARRMDVLRAEHRAIVAHTDAQLRGSAELLRASGRAIVVHRSSWFTDKVCAELGARGIRVVARLTNGAEAVGAVVAEQPDLLLVEDSLPMLSGEDVVREVRAFAPATRIAAHVAYDNRVAALLEAGASSAYTRRVPPATVAQGLADLLTNEPQPA